MRDWRQAAPLEDVLISLFFFLPLLPWCEDQRRMRRDARQEGERRSIATTMADTHGASSPPPLSFFLGSFFFGGPFFLFFFGGGGGKGRDPRGGPSRITAPPPLLFFFLRGRIYRASMSDQKHDIVPIAESVEQDPGSSSRL